MNNIEIHQILKRYECFSGVFPSDLLPKLTRVPIALVVNTESSDKNGQHWIGLFIDENLKGEIFDSFGRAVLPDLIIDYMKRYCKGGIKISNFAIQHNDSIVCGAYAILFVVYRSLGYSFLDFLNTFSAHSKIFNDEYVLALVSSIRNI